MLLYFAVCTKKQTAIIYAQIIPNSVPQVSLVPLLANGEKVINVSCVTGKRAFAQHCQGTEGRKHRHKRNRIAKRAELFGTTTKQASGKNKSWWPIRDSDLGFMVQTIAPSVMCAAGIEARSVMRAGR